jgi:hypothetical protein
MRRPTRYVGEAEAAKALLHRKTLEEPLEAILSEATRADGYARGSSKEGGWMVEISVRSHILHARLLVGDQSILGLDHHKRPADDGVGGTVGTGYHWDVRPPLVKDPRRIRLDPQPIDAVDAFARLCLFWHIAPTETTQRRLL